ncbi:hypothetical protein VTJ83DRAFT_4538 [Remersonia thermophila]|uniref:cyclin-dependent kinase n=1 Tax=Remersonia thermophila TaxID=72144 RepID=A0ABR4DBQ7_9PEZI
MADVGDWRRSLTASERYTNIQKLTQALKAASLSRSAFSIEEEAYKNAESRASIHRSIPSSEPESPPEPPHSTATAEDQEEHDDSPSSPGITIGPYQNCHYVASGVTAAVYRSRQRALKVIVETRNLAPHNPTLEAKLLADLRAASAPNIIPLLSTFHDHDQRLVLVFPYMPFSLDHLLSTHRARNGSGSVAAPLPPPVLRAVFTALFRALAHLHAQGIVHRDVKPSAVLLSSLSPSPAGRPGDVYLADLGAAHHPAHSPLLSGEPADAKVLDVGTGPYRAPEALFGHRAYAAPLDLWSAGCVLAECLRGGEPLFESRPAHEDGSQLGLVLSIFKTLGTPTEETWPEAKGFRTPPFEMYRVFEGTVEREGWRRVLLGRCGSAGHGGECDEWDEWVGLVERLVRYESATRVTAAEALRWPCLRGGG